MTLDDLTGATTVRHFMSAAVVDFRRRYPQASLEFQTETSGRACFDSLAAGIRPVLDTSVADWDTAVLLAELGLGHAVVPTLPAGNGPAHPDLRLIPIPALPALTAGWAARRRDALSPLARAFAETVARHCGKQTVPGP
ncbi:DNA-binding transcriptional LysR family regulator [Kitasatospora sp. MAA4]|nr:DNA-binding transcriptional LysR family regulator [Kitasatospora sp. MAA4]